jgi:hypothetical protein
VKSAYGLDTPRGTPWQEQALCQENPDMWSSPHTEVLSVALHICWTHCPVRLKCSQEGRRTPRELRRGVVYGGRYFSADKGELDPRQRLTASRCGRC